MSAESTVVVRSTPTNWRVNILAGAHELEGALDEAMTERLREISQRCPVKQTLERGIAIHLVP